MDRVAFYKSTIQEWIKEKDANILVVAGGKTDSQVFSELGYANVTISNLDSRIKKNEFHPFQWSYQDAERLSYTENAFDYVVVHAALHHCHSPHRALLNMYRAASAGVILIESRDSFTMSLITRLGLTQTYECAAVFYNEGKYGGVANTDIPNYVYRWTEREIEKTINTYAPYAPHSFYYRYGYDIPRSSERRKKGAYKMIVVKCLQSLYSFFAKMFPKQQNLFACFIEKLDCRKSHFEWLTYEDGKFVFNREWADNFFVKNGTD